MRRSIVLSNLILMALAVSCATTTRVAFTTGDTEFYGDDAITIESITGPNDRLEIGRAYRIRGDYRLSTKPAANLLLSSTTSGPREAGISEVGRLRVERGAGEFDFEFTIVGEGDLHLTYYDLETGRPFGGIYFGSGESVLFEKGYSYDDPTR